MNEKPYHIEKKGNAVVLRTSCFRTERRSILHSGIFNRELASSLAAGAVIVVLGFFFAVYFKITVIYFMAAVLLFAALFMFFRVYVFRETILETVFDKERKTVTVSLKRTIGSRIQAYPADALAGIGIHHLSIEPENMDAVKLIERVAVQHGTVIPGFGKIEDFYNVELDFRDRRVVIYSGRERESAVSVVAEMKGSLDGLLPDTVWKS